MNTYLVTNPLVNGYDYRSSVIIIVNKKTLDALHCQ
jgi:hypothetical protein